MGSSGEWNRAAVKGIVEDIQWVMKYGETDPDVIASRVGYEKKTSLARRLHRHGYHEIARKFDYRENRRRGRPRQLAPTARRCPSCHRPCKKHQGNVERWTATIAVIPAGEGVAA